jgi:hypothetical protein
MPAKSERRVENGDLCGDRETTHTELRAFVPFPSTGGVDVSLHTLGPGILRTPEHRRRDHRYAVQVTEVGNNELQLYDARAERKPQSFWYDN